MKASDTTLFWDNRDFSGAVSSNPWGQDFRPNFVSLGGFQTPPTKMSYTTPHHIPKYEILQKRDKIVNYPSEAL